MKATCIHGRPWFGPCADCSAEAAAPAVDALPLWRFMTPDERAQYAEAAMAAEWRFRREQA